MLDQWTPSGPARDTRRIANPHNDLIGAETDVDSLLRTLPRLCDLAGAAWERALASATVVRESSGARLPLPGGTANHFVVVLRGAMILRGSSEDGRVFNMYKVRAGEICTLSLMALTDRSSAVPVSEVVAEGDLLLLRIPARYLDALLTECREFRELMLASMIRCVVHTLDLVEEVTFDRLQTRVERHLRETHRATGTHVLKVAHQELANELGSTREGISRVLKQMERCGLIQLGRGAITLLPPLLRS